MELCKQKASSVVYELELSEQMTSETVNYSGVIKIGIVQTNDFGCWSIKWIVQTIDFECCLLAGIV